MAIGDIETVLLSSWIVHWLKLQKYHYEAISEQIQFELIDTLEFLLWWWLVFIQYELVVQSKATYWFIIEEREVCLKKSSNEYTVAAVHSEFVFSMVYLMSRFLNYIV